MNYTIFFHEVQWYQYLNGKSLYQVQTKSLKVVHFDKFVQIDTQEFKSEYEMLSKDELVKPSNYILFIFWVSLIQVLNQLAFDKTLFVESLFVFKDF